MDDELPEGLPEDDREKRRFYPLPSEYGSVHQPPINSTGQRFCVKCGKLRWTIEVEKCGKLTHDCVVCVARG